LTCVWSQVRILYRPLNLQDDIRACISKPSKEVGSQVSTKGGMPMV
jgi:hypothetical protein